MPTFRAKPVQAEQFDGRNHAAISALILVSKPAARPSIATPARGQARFYESVTDGTSSVIDFTLSVGDWVVALPTGPQRMNAKEFEATYDEVPAP